VVSRSGDVDTSWQSSVLLRDIADVKRLREEDGPNLVTQGSTELVHALLANDLVDAISTFTVPVVLGGGKRLFGGRLSAAQLQADSIASLEYGLVIAHYEGGEVKVADTGLAEPSKAEAARQARMKREG
jgi:dihydrofolate reductase